MNLSSENLKVSGDWDDMLLLYAPINELKEDSNCFDDFVRKLIKYLTDDMLFDSINKKYILHCYRDKFRVLGNSNKENRKVGILIEDVRIKIKGSIELNKSFKTLGHLSQYLNNTYDM